MAGKQLEEIHEILRRHIHVAFTEALLDLRDFEGKKNKKDPKDIAIELLRQFKPLKEKIRKDLEEFCSEHGFNIEKFATLSKTLDEIEIRLIRNSENGTLENDISDYIKTINSLKVNFHN